MQNRHTIRAVVDSNTAIGVLGVYEESLTPRYTSARSHLHFPMVKIIFAVYTLSRTQTYIIRNAHTHARTHSRTHKRAHEVSY